MGGSSVALEAPPLSEQLAAAEAERRRRGRLCANGRRTGRLAPVGFESIPQEDQTSMWQPVFTKAGQHEGIGVLMNVIGAIYREWDIESFSKRSGQRAFWITKTMVRQCDDLAPLLQGQQSRPSTRLTSMDLLKVDVGSGKYMAMS